MSRLATVLALTSIAASAGEAAEGPISWEQAKCIMDGRTMYFYGDSNTRFHFYTFNVFLDTGELRSCGYDKWGCEGSDYNSGEKNQYWTEPYGRSEDGSHRMNMCKDFDNDAKTCFWFIQTTWFDNDEQPDADNMADLAEDVDGKIVVYNSLWWDGKSWGEDDRGYDQCGNDWTDDCEEAYTEDLETVVEKMLKPADAAVFRDSSCCADYTSDREAGAAFVEIGNRVAKSVMDAEGIDYVEVYDLYGPDDIDDATRDGTHAEPEYYHEWTMRMLASIDEQLGTNCLDGGGDESEDEEEEDEEEDEPEETDRPTYEPTYMPSYQPTRQPTEAPEPECEDSGTWYYKGKASKDCDWVAKKAAKKTKFCKKSKLKDPEGVKAKKGCPAACDKC
jgi:hypothetical protein